MHRKWFLILLIQFSLVACGGSSQPEEFRQVGNVTDTPFTSPTTTPTDTPTLTPSNTPTSTYTQTPTHIPTDTPTLKPTITPTPTITPENFVLAESGNDIANVRVSYPREDTMLVDFDYRLSDDIERAMITMQLPADCRDDWVFVFDAPNTDVFDPVGSSSILYKLPLEGTCAHKSFYLNIHPMTREDGYFMVEDIAYQEEIDLPFQIERSFATINSDVLTVKNFSFESTGSWTGNISFDYNFSDEIPLEQEKYYFSIRGSGGGGACEFQKDGEIITESSGIYVVEIALPDDLYFEGNDCTEQYTYYLFDNYFLYLSDYDSDDLIYVHVPSLEALFVD